MNKLLLIVCYIIFLCPSFIHAKELLDGTIFNLINDYDYLKKIETKSPSFDSTIYGVSATEKLFGFFVGWATRKNRIASEDGREGKIYFFDRGSDSPTYECK